MSIYDTKIVEVSHIAKSFGDTQAVQDVSFDIKKGEIFGMLGPNGAGKTTTIRLMLDIFRPDHGVISILGGAMNDTKKERIGYMPEERGLYQDVPLERCLIYLATLKGMPTTQAQHRLGELLEQFDLAEHKSKKVKELSKGMQQKAQIINAILHNPEFLIIDEPFAALDPINTQLVKDLMRSMRTKGTTILMSTHQMHQVEELCDRILLIDKGANVLYGKLEDIRRQFIGNAVLVKTTCELPDIQGVEQVTNHNHTHKITLSPDLAPQQLLQKLVAQDIEVEKFEIATPSLDEIFIRAVKAQETPDE